MPQEENYKEEEVSKRRRNDGEGNADNEKNDHADRNHAQDGYFTIGFRGGGLNRMGGRYGAGANCLEDHEKNRPL